MPGAAATRGRESRGGSAEAQADMATALEKAQVDISSFYSAIGQAKAYRQSTFNVGGVSYTIYEDVGDSQSSVKKICAHEAVRLMRAAGVAMPADMRFYLTSAYEAQNRAYHFDQLGRSISWVTLGTRALSGGSGRGISAQLTPGVESCTKICIHEIGHSVHAQRIGLTEFFTPATAGRWQGRAANANKVSDYAGGSRKEFVAEVFLGRVIGRTYDTATMQEYANLGGPPV